MYIESIFGPEVIPDQPFQQSGFINHPEALLELSLSLGMLLISTCGNMLLSTAFRMMPWRKLKDLWIGLPSWLSFPLSASKAARLGLGAPH